MVSKPFAGQLGIYFTVRNNDSTYGLSSPTLGRLYDEVIPNSSILTLNVSDLIGAPLPE